MAPHSSTLAWKIPWMEEPGRLQSMGSLRVGYNWATSLSFSALLILWITINCGKFWKRWEYQTTWPASWETCMQVRKQQLELDMEQQFQIGKGVCQGCILSPCLFNLYSKYIMRNAGLNEAQAGIKIAGRNINNLRYTDDTTLMAESEELQSLLMKWKRRVKKLAWNLTFRKWRSWHLVPSLHGK